MTTKERIVASLADSAGMAMILTVMLLDIALLQHIQGWFCNA